MDANARRVMGNRTLMYRVIKQLNKMESRMKTVEQHAKEASAFRTIEATLARDLEILECPYELIYLTSWNLYIVQGMTQVAPVPVIG